MRYRTLVALAAALGSTALFAVAAGGAAASPTLKLHSIRGTCGLDLRAGFAHCNLSLLARSDNTPFAAAGPTGYGPADLQSAYAIPAGGSGQTVAIVDAYDDSTAEADVNFYRSHYGLPACTTAGGCFKKVNQNGVQGSYPSNNQSWAVEISLDLDMVSAICPACHILLVEASSSSSSNLYKAEDTAASLHPAAISNSWGGSETSSDTANNVHFNHPGIAITVSSGDSGYGVQYPASSPYVTAVGGTSLSRASNARGWTETAWSGAGSGCSARETRQSWEPSGACARRTVADVSAVADPNTGVSVYDSDCTGLNAVFGNCFKGWGTVGGTSASSPIIAGVYALAGNTGSITYGSYPYSHTSALNDVTSGSNGSCGGTYLCTAGPGYDGPTGLGTPNGTGGF